MGRIVKFKGSLPKPKDVGVVVPMIVDHDLFQQGWEHGLTSNRLLKREHLKASFREGFRAAKLYLKQLRADKGILELPVTGKIKFTTKVE